MFKFNFGQILDYPLELEDDMGTDGSEHEIIISPIAEQENNPKPSTQERCEQVSLEAVMKTLSPIISYTPLFIKGGGKNESNSIRLPRRDLYDARFQIISEGALSDEEDDEDEDRMDVEPPELNVTEHTTLPPQAHLAYIDAPSDVIPDIYEGGLKTWECSIDVVEYLSRLDALPFAGKAILEVGCGTAIPTAYLLQNLFNSAPSDKQTVIHLQDYNKSVLELVTLPNLILAWYSSIASHPYRTSLPLPTPDPDVPGELPITPELTAAFLQSLQTHQIQLHFWAGSWSSFEPRGPSDAPFDLVITSETIYRSANVSSLLSVLRSASITEPKTGFFTGLLNRSRDTAPLVLVAAKILYFGVGGSVDEFKTIAQNSGVTVTTVLDIEIGVGRRILKLDFTS